MKSIEVCGCIVTKCENTSRYMHTFYSFPRLLSCCIKMSASPLETPTHLVRKQVHADFTLAYSSYMF